MKRNKIIFHHLPPSLPSLPSPSFSILKSFMNRNGYDVDVIYWNVLMGEGIFPFAHDYYNFMNNFGEFDSLILLPFISIIANKYQDNRSMKRILAYLERTSPGFQKVSGYYSKILEESKIKTFQVIDSVLEGLKMDEVILFGISSKFYQWIPGLILTEKLKERFPHIKIVVGGFGNKEAALEALRIGAYYDFAIWGEGEYPLLELSNLSAERKEVFESVPRLAFRHENKVIVTSKSSKYLDFQNYIFPDHADYISLLVDNGDKNIPYELPIETVRGCHWNKCKFCYFNVGYKYRSRALENIIQEIDILFQKYGKTRFRFVDNDIVCNDMSRFEKLLDMIIILSNKHKTNFQFYAEITHRNFNSRIIEKMVVAGFNEVQIGYEAITDGLLKKMNKKTDFADHILFLKFALKTGMNVAGANIIRGIVGETCEDVIESIKNLVFLRFFFDRENMQFFHVLRQLRLQGGTKFLKDVGDKDRNNWNFNPITHLLPKSFIDEDRRFSLFDYTKHLENHREWDWFEQVNKYYEETKFTYNILNDKNVNYYHEYRNNIKIEQITFNKPEYWDVLKKANNEVKSHEDIFILFRDSYQEISRDRLREIILELKDLKLLYANKDLSRVISIIDTNSAR